LSCLCSYVDSGEKEEEEEPAILGTAPTSTSNTMVLSEEDRAAAGSSAPPEQIIPTSTPPASPRAPSPKRHKTGAGEDQTLVLGSSSTSMMNDVSFLRIRFCCFLSRFHSPFPNFPSSCSSICLLFDFFCDTFFLPTAFNGSVHPPRLPIYRVSQRGQHFERYS
jgi:hypothetical protein